MPLITNTVPSMIGGVSQAPEILRLPNQCEVQENAVSSIVDGLSKRPPTKHVKQLQATDASLWLPSIIEHSFHTINRDTSERYFVTIEQTLTGGGKIHVHNTSGENIVVYGDTDTYLNLAGGFDNPAENFDFLTVADVTFITNKQTTVDWSSDTAPYSRSGQGLSADPWPTTGGAAEALLWVNKSDYNKTYKVYIDNTLVALHKTPDGINTDVSIGSAELKFLDYASDLDTKYVTLKALDDDGFIRTRTYKFDDDGTSGLPANTGKFVDTDLNFKGVFDIAKIRNGDVAEPESPTTNDFYEIVQNVASEGSISWDLNTGSSGDWTIWDTNPGSGAVEVVVKAGDKIKWDGDAWVKITTAANITVGINGMTTRAGAALQLQNAITSTNGHKGVLGVRLTNEDDLVAEGSDAAAAALVTNNILTVSQTRSGFQGNTVITTNVAAADIEIPSAFTGGSIADGVGDQPEDLIAGTESVAEGLATQLEAVDGYTTMQSGSVVYVHKTANTDINITVEESGGGDDLKVIKRTVQQFTDLPPVAPEGFIVEISGAVEKDIDNYYVKFEADGSQASDNYLGTGRYIETIKPGIKYKLDPETMPHILIRQSNTTFYFKAADGTTPGDVDGDGLADDGNTAGVPDGADYTKYGWHNRLVGDLVTNLDPSFVGFTINALSLFKGRLVFLSDENVIFSEASIFWNFFKVKTTVLTDADRIDISPTGEKVSILRSMLAYNDQLIVSSDQTQFAIKGNPMVTPTTVSASPVSDFETYKDCEPIRLGTSIFYPFKRGEFSGLRELFVTNGIDLSFATNDLTEAVPAYIPGNIRQIAGSTHESVICALSDDYFEKNKIFVYNFDQRGGKTVLASWSTFVFDCQKILNMSFIEGVLYLMIDRVEYTEATDTYHTVALETMDLSSGLRDQGSEFVVNLDRRHLMTGDDDEVTYDSATDTTTIVLPYAHSTSAFSLDEDLTPRIPEDVMVVSADATYTWPYTAQAEAGYIYTVSEFVLIDEGGGNPLRFYNTIKVNGDLTQTGLRFYVGVPYIMTYEFTEISVKKSDYATGRVEPVMGRHQLRYGEVSYSDSAYFKVKVTPKNKDASIYTFTGKQLGSITSRLGATEVISSGSFRFPIFSKSGEVKIEIINDSPLPSKLVSASFDAMFQPRISTRSRL